MNNQTTNNKTTNEETTKDVVITRTVWIICLILCIIGGVVIFWEESGIPMWVGLACINISCIGTNVFLWKKNARKKE